MPAREAFLCRCGTTNLPHLGRFVPMHKRRINMACTARGAAVVLLGEQYLSATQLQHLLRPLNMPCYLGLPHASLHPEPSYGPPGEQQLTADVLTGPGSVQLPVRFECKGPEVMCQLTDLVSGAFGCSEGWIGALSPGVQQVALCQGTARAAWRVVDARSAAAGTVVAEVTLAGRSWEQVLSLRRALIATAARHRLLQQQAGGDGTTLAARARDVFGTAVTTTTAASLLPEGLSAVAVALEQLLHRLHGLQGQAHAALSDACSLQRDRQCSASAGGASDSQDMMQGAQEGDRSQNFEQVWEDAAVDGLNQAGAKRRLSMGGLQHIHQQLLPLVHGAHRKLAEMETVRVLVL